MDTAQKTFTQADGLTWDEVEDRVVVLDSAGSSMITLNPVASLLWPRLASPSSAEALVGALHEVFEHVPADELQRDVEAFLEELIGEGLIEVVEPD